METAGDIIDAVRASGYETDQDDRAFIMLNIEQRTVVADHRWRFMRETAQVSGTAGNATYTLPVSPPLMHVESIRFTQVDTTFYELDWHDSESLIALAMAEVTEGIIGQPRYWTDVTPETFMVYPTPTQGGVFNVRYLRKAADMTDESDVPDIPEEYLDVLRAGVCMRLAARERQWDAKREFEAERTGLLAAMKGQYGIRQVQSAHRVAESGRYGYRADAHLLRRP